MKKLYIFTTALLMLAGTFTSCTKDLDDVGLNASSVDAAKKEVKATNNSDKIEADMYLNFSDTTPKVGSTITISIGFNSNTPSGGKIHLEQWMLNSDNVLTWVKIADFSVKDAQLPFTHSFTSHVAGPIQFRAHYITEGTKGFNNTFKYGSVTFVEAECNQGMTATVTNATRLEGNNYRITVAFSLNTCEDYSDVKIQGGLTAHVSNISTNAKLLNEVGQGNQIRYWKEASLAAGTYTYTVTFDKVMTESGVVTGDWSAEVNGEKIAKTDGGAYFDITKW